MKHFILSLLFSILCLPIFAQVGIGTTSPDAGAALDIVSSDKGILIPRLETNAVVSPVDGMMIYQPSDQSFYYYKGTAWTKIGGISTEMVDADADTKIRLLEGFRDNIVFSLDGTDYLRYEKSSTGSFRMELLNNNNNLAFGSNALFGNTNGMHNHAFGQEALFSNQEGNNNTAIGRRSLFSNNNGNNNTAIGLNALTMNASGNFNTAIGLNALFSNVGGDHNTAIGRDALVDNTGDNNVAIGDSSLSLNTMGGENIAIGSQALKLNITGSSNIAFGFRSMSNNFVGSNNIALGTESLHNNNLGGDNIALGFFSMNHNEDGANNIAIGSLAMSFNEIGNNNIAFGNKALRNSINSDYNIAIGFETLLTNNNTTGKNIAIGESAGAFSSGQENIALGGFSGFLSTGNENIFIGNGAGHSSTGNNTLYIENSDADSTEALIYGEFNNNMLRVNDKLGIGTQSVGYPLSIRGDANNDIMMLKDHTDNDQWHLKLTGTNNLNFVESGVVENRLVLKEGGNVGIGLANPNANLHIQTGNDPTLKIQSNGVDEISGRLSLRQSNETGVDIYYDGNSATDALVIQPYTAGIPSANKLKVALDGQLTIDNMQEALSGDPVVRLLDGKLAIKKISIGDYYHGGIVFWLDESGEHGLVCALNDIAEQSWGNGTILRGAIYDGMYSGKRNTDMILTHNDPNLIASKCALVMEANYGDWYMPSLEELKILRSNLTLVNPGISSQGGTTIGNEFYWSSKENSSTNAFFANMGGSLTGHGNKLMAYKTRAIRAF